MKDEMMRLLKRYGIETEEELMSAIEQTSLDISMFANDGEYHLY